MQLANSRAGTTWWHFGCLSLQAPAVGRSDGCHSIAISPSPCWQVSALFPWDFCMWLRKTQTDLTYFLCPGTCWQLRETYALPHRIVFLDTLIKTHRITKEINYTESYYNIKTKQNKTHPRQDLVNICTSSLTHQITRLRSRSDI